MIISLVEWGWIDFFLYEMKFPLELGVFPVILQPRWRGGRVVEGARLERVYTGNRIKGSNPFLSAIRASWSYGVSFYPTQYNEISKVWLRLFLKRFFLLLFENFLHFSSVCVFRWWGSIFYGCCQTNAHPFQKSRESHFYASDKLITLEEVSFVFARMFVWWWDAFRD